MAGGSTRTSGGAGGEYQCAERGFRGAGREYGRATREQKHKIGVSTGVKRRRLSQLPVTCYSQLGDYYISGRGSIGQQIILSYAKRLSSTNLGLTSERSKSPYFRYLFFI